jgi:hypothetical protein
VVDNYSAAQDCLWFGGRTFITVNKPTPHPPEHLCLKSILILSPYKSLSPLLPALGGESKAACTLLNAYSEAAVAIVLCLLGIVVRGHGYSGAF